jgi:hypothetical protein
MAEKTANQNSSRRPERNPLTMSSDEPRISNLRKKVEARLRKDAEEWEQRTAETSSAVEAALRFIVRS